VTSAAVSSFDRVVVIEHGGRALTVAYDAVERGEEWIVCLHGVQTNRLLFRPLYDRPDFARWSLLALDLTGFGASSKDGGFSYALADQAALLRSVLDRLGIRRMHLFGHSMGGMIATIMLADRDTGIRSLVSLEGNLTPDDCGASAEVAAQSFEQFAAVYPEYKARWSHAAGDPAVRRRWLDAIPDHVMHRSCRSIIEWSASRRLRDALAVTSVPAMYVYGGRDAHRTSRVPLAVSRCEIPGAGHFMMLDDPEATWRQVAAFLDQR
jgi:pimeloyl-ACP methyl ester carboxylesterase